MPHTRPQNGHRTRMGTVSDRIRTTRFVNTSTTDVKASQARDAEAVVKEIENLKKKENYLEQTLKNSQEHMEALFKRGG